MSESIIAPATCRCRIEDLAEVIGERIEKRRIQILTREDVAESLELAGVPVSGTGPGRCRLRVFRIREGRDAGRWGAFFYKPSVIPHSRDRYSYGAAVFDELHDPARVSKWLDYLESGFDPLRIPADVLNRLGQVDPPEPRRSVW